MFCNGQLQKRVLFKIAEFCLLIWSHWQYNADQNRARMLLAQCTNTEGKAGRLVTCRTSMPTKVGREGRGPARDLGLSYDICPRVRDCWQDTAPSGCWEWASLPNVYLVSCLWPITNPNPNTSSYLHINILQAIKHWRLTKSKKGVKWEQPMSSLAGLARETSLRD